MLASKKDTHKRDPAETKLGGIQNENKQKTQYFTTFSAVSCHLRKSKDSNGVSTVHTYYDMLKKCFFVQMQVLSNAGVISKMPKMLIHMSTSLFLLY